MIFFLLLSILFLLLLWWILQYYYYFKDIRSIPTPWFTLPIFGNLFEVKDPVEALWVLHKLTMTVGKGIAIRGSLGFFFGISIAEPNFLEHIMTHSSAISKSNLYKYLHNWLGTGLLTSKGAKWHKRRKLLSPTYHFKILEQFLDVFDKNSDILVRRLQLEQDNNRVDIYPFINLCALDVICETAMGTSVNAQLNSESNFVKATREMKRIVVERAVSPFKIWDFTYQFTSDYRTEKEMLKVLHDYTHNIIVRRRKELINEQSKQEISKQHDIPSDVGAKKRVPFLDLLLQMSMHDSQLSDEDIREEVDTFIFEGHDTVTAAISFCIYSIANNPTIQNRIISELKQIYQENPARESILNDLQKMRYLDMVIKETLRLYPSVPFYGRNASDDIKYKDMIIKKGSEISIGVYSVHRNPDIYPQPEVFDPERFTAEACAKRHPFAYLPFSAGFRNCIGQKFAILEMKSTISKLLRNFEFTAAPNSDIKLKSELIINSATGIHVGIHPRVW